VPGVTVGANNLRGSDVPVSFVRSFFEQKKPDDVPAFCSNIVEGFAEGKHDEQKRSA
jgi:protease I